MAPIASIGLYRKLLYRITLTRSTLCAGTAAGALTRAAISVSGGAAGVASSAWANAMARRRERVVSVCLAS